MIIRDINGIKLYYLHVDKFTTSQFGILIKTISNRKFHLADMIVRQLMTKMTSKYNDEELLNDHLQNLYSANLSTIRDNLGNTSIINFTSKFINDEYVLDDTKIFEEIVKVYNDMFTTPSFYINNEFNENMINKEKYLTLINYDSIENDDIVCALFDILSKTFYDEVEKEKYLKDKEALLNITNEDLLEAYYNIVNSEKIFYYIGAYSVDEVEKTIRENFTYYVNKPHIVNYDTKLFNDIEKVEYNEIEKDNHQSLLFMTYSYEDKDYLNYETVGNLFIKMISGRSTSDLFQEVREKHNLAYFISGINLKLNQLFIIYSGIDKANIDKTKELIDEVFNRYTNGEFTKEHEEALEAVKKEYISYKKNLFDKTSGYYNQIADSFIYNRDITLDDEINEIKKVTLKDIQEFSKKYTKRLIYVVKGVAGNEEDC